MLFLSSNLLLTKRISKLRSAVMIRCQTWFRFFSSRPDSSKSKMKISVSSCRLSISRSELRTCNFTEWPSKLRKSFKASTLRKKKTTRNVWTCKQPSLSWTAKRELMRSRLCSLNCVVRSKKSNKKTSSLRQRPASCRSMLNNDSRSKVLSLALQTTQTQIPARRPKT